jgi:hypothetical protein
MKKSNSKFAKFFKNSSGDSFERLRFSKYYRKGLIKRKIEDAEFIASFKKVVEGSPFSLDSTADLENFLGKGVEVLKVIHNDYYEKYFINETIDSVAALASFLEVSREEIQRNLDEPKYNRFYIWKDAEHTKKRWIEAPNDELKNIQEKILYKILYKFHATKFAHGFVRGKSVVSCAKEHTGKKFVLKIDLKNFFPSITREMVYHSLRDMINKDNFKYIITAAEMCLLDGRLPQGAPTSPALSNLVMISLDMCLYGIARKFGCSYTRYADDLVFSSNDETIYKMIPIIKRAIDCFGLVVNEKKVKVLKKHQRQKVTGLVVNSEGQTSVERRKRMNLRAYVHHILTGKRDINTVNMSKLKGHISFIEMANPSQAIWFNQKLAQISLMKNA